MEISPKEKIKLTLWCTATIGGLIIGAKALLWGIDQGLLTPSILFVCITLMALINTTAFGGMAFLGWATTGKSPPDDVMMLLYGVTATVPISWAAALYGTFNVDDPWKVITTLGILGVPWVMLAVIPYFPRGKSRETHAGDSP